MSVGVQLFNASGALVWDSTTAVGGVAADLRTVPAGGPQSYTYPDFAGRTPMLLGTESGLVGDGGASITVDTALGYPRVIAVGSGFPRTFLLMVS